MKYVYILICFVWFASCTKDRVLPFANTTGTNPITPITPVDTTKEETIVGKLKINEYLTKGSQNVDGFGEKSDWIEIYNTTDADFEIKDEEWFITDDLTKPDKYKLPSRTITPKGFLLIWCNGKNTNTATSINTNFNLSASGESIGIYFRDKDDNFIPVDSLSFGVQTLDAVSNGRKPDGSENWTTLTTPTPGATNN
jgi:hypothetical protein